MKPIKDGERGILPPLSVVPAGPPGTYLGIAENLIPAIKVLAVTSGTTGIPLALLSAHSLECILKAFLSRDGSDTRLTTPKIRHDLEALWHLSAAEGLQLELPAPAWVGRLSLLHKAPYFLRYSTGVHGIVTPAPEPMSSELIALYDAVRVRLSKL